MSDSATDAAGGMVVERKRHSLLVDFFIRLVREKPMGTVGGIIVLILIICAIFAPELSAI